MSPVASPPPRIGGRKSTAVSVADLRAQHDQQEGAARTGHPTTAPAQILTADLLRREGRAEDERAPNPSRVSRAILRTAGTAVVLGAVVMGAAGLSSSDEGRRAVPPRLQGGERGHLSGSDVVRPDLIRAWMDKAARGGGSGSPGTPHGKAGPSQDKQLQDKKEESQPLDNAADPVVGPVLDFFSSATETPADAFRLLGPGMQAGGFPAFAASWTGITEAIVHDAGQVAANSVVVEVSLQRDDGRALHTIQEMTVEPGGEHRIVDATLLSAVGAGTAMFGRPRAGRAAPTLGP